MGTEGEIAASVIFLLSPASAYISGATLKVDGASSSIACRAMSSPTMNHGRRTARLRMMARGSNHLRGMMWFYTIMGTVRVLKGRG